MSLIRDAMTPSSSIETLQRLVAQMIATHPAGLNLLLIGGFRYRLLDNIPRFSRDINYHWDGDLTEKQQQLIKLCRRGLIPQVRRQLGYEAGVHPATGPESESPDARFVDLSFWRPNVAHSRVEIPLEITRVACLDPTTVRTSDGIVYPTPSEGDLIESKILAVLNRIHLAHRDLIDLFLFGNRLLSDSPQRLQEKLQRVHSDDNAIRKRLIDLGENADYHSRALQQIIDNQLDPAVAANLNLGGGGSAVLQRAVDLLRSNLPSAHENTPVD
jgi:hypothetical protein